MAETKGEYDKGMKKQVLDVYLDNLWKGFPAVPA
jgi:hypothetical protein